jgi:hypothetical protein
VEINIASKNSNLYLIVESPNRSMKVKWFLAIVLIGFVFLDSIYLPFDFGFDFRLQYIAFIACIFLYPLISKINVRRSSLLTGGFVLVFLLLMPLSAGTPLLGAIRQLALILICSTPFYFMFSSLDFSYLKIFNLYLFFSFLLSVVGIIQFASMLIHFKPGYDFSYLGFDMSRVSPEELRVQAWMLEPSFLVYILIPATFYSLVRLFGLYKIEIIRSKWQCLIIIVAVLLTRSLLGYLSIFLMSSLVFLTKFPIHKKPIYSFILIILLFGFAMFAFSIPSLKLRIIDTFEAFSGNVEEIRSTNLSTQHLYDNFQVVNLSLKKHPLLGVGLGNYYIMYEKLSHAAPDSDLTPDGSSLLFRMITETGVAFTIMTLWLTFSFRVKMKSLKSEEFKDLWVISNGIFIFIIMRWLRFPHYTAVGFTFFLILYYLTFYIIKLRRKQLT